MIGYFTDAPRSNDHGAGINGGVEWGGLMTDPNAHLAFFNSERIVWMTAVTDRAGATPDGRIANSVPVQLFRLPQVPRSRRLSRDRSAMGHADRSRSEHRQVRLADSVWRISRAGEKGITNTGSENYGSGVVTSNVFLFIGSSNFDSKMRVYDAKSGKLIWEMSLPFPGNASPAMYMVNGRQYIAFSTSSGRAPKLHEKGSMLVAYALPQ